MNYLKTFGILVVSLAGNFVLAQNVLPSDVNSAGTTLTNGSTSLEFTFGEVATFPFSVGGLQLKPGILQPPSLDAVLPVNLIRFDVIRTEKETVLLTWETAAEVNNHGFYIERRNANESEFKPVRFILARSTESSDVTAYSEQDHNRFEGISYYRLKQEDLDGTFTYSKIRAVEGRGKDQVTLTAWPVPANGSFSVKLSGNRSGTLFVYTLNGVLLKQMPINTVQPLSVILPNPGTYLLRFSGEKNLVEKVVVH